MSVNILQLSAEEPIQISEPIHFIPWFNKALVLFNLRQPQSSLKILLALMPHLNKMGKKPDRYSQQLSITTTELLADESLAQRSGLLTINILLNTYQVKKAGILIEQLQKRLSLSPDQLISDDDEDDDLDGVNIRGATTAKEVRSPDLFRWMFKLYTIRWNVLSAKNILIANGDV